MKNAPSFNETVPRRRGSLLKFSLKSLLLAMLLAALGLGLFQTTLLLGAAMIVFSLAALWRTARISRRAAIDRSPLGPLALTGVFLRSVQIVAVLVFAALGTVLCGALSALLAAGVVAVELMVRSAAWLQRGAQGANRLRRILVCATRSCASANAGWLRRYCAT